MNPHAEAQVPKTCVSAISPLPQEMDGKNTCKTLDKKIQAIIHSDQLDTAPRLDTASMVADISNTAPVTINLIPAG